MADLLKRMLGSKDKRKKQAVETRNAIRSALPRPPLNPKDLSDIAKGQNSDVIRQRRAAINRGKKLRQKYGQRD